METCRPTGPLARCSWAQVAQSVRVIVSDFGMRDVDLLVVCIDLPRVYITPGVMYMYCESWDLRFRCIFVARARAWHICAKKEDRPWSPWSHYDKFAAAASVFCHFGRFLDQRQMWAFFCSSGKRCSQVSVFADFCLYLPNLVWRFPYTSMEIGVQRLGVSGLCSKNGRIMLSWMLEGCSAKPEIMLLGALGKPQRKQLNFDIMTMEYVPT